MRALAWNGSGNERSDLPRRFNSAWPGHSRIGAVGDTRPSKRRNPAVRGELPRQDGRPSMNSKSGPLSRTTGFPVVLPRGPRGPNLRTNVDRSREAREGIWPSGHPQGQLPLGMGTSRVGPLLGLTVRTAPAPDRIRRS